MISIAAISLDIERLEPVSATVPRLAKVVADENSSVDDICNVIEYDPALTANAIKLANSAYFASPGEVQTVREAIHKIGAGRILQDAVGRELGPRFLVAVPAYELDELELWQHSIAAATAASLLPRYSKVAIPPVAFTAALLHDFGKLVIGRHLDDESRADIMRATDEGMTYVQAERYVLGLDHAQVGGLVARRWKFPEELANCIAWHHHPLRDNLNNPALDAVHIANAVAKTIGLGLGVEGMNMKVDTDAVRSLGLTMESIETLCAQTMLELPKTLELFEDVHRGV
ncbi:MAG: HDOD domain-containing protein [Calditrichaeota bacterium]|nr:HDOD domain-containing protein [Calditrichota bacterium]MCB9369115.1 HDOD domain-containing protein [Calditrichota bacterium]